MIFSGVSSIQGVLLCILVMQCRSNVEKPGGANNVSFEC